MARLDETRWRSLSPLLDRALELEGEERVAFISSLRPARPDEAAELERLLAGEGAARASGFLELPEDPAARGSLAGSIFGAYTLVAPLGSGGMGTVWRARRSDGRFERDVAVKLLHPSLLDRDGEARFQREGTVLSRLSHHGIARLFDAGISPAGQPYLVLELVDGEPIDRWADERRLSVEARLRLFLQVAEAVAHAHTSLVVHRDLKPSNILVDRTGRTKLLDFGIAALLDTDSGSAPPTAVVGRALTPRYAAPEQLSGGAVTTATDVYALGVLLYELLTGCHPFAPVDAAPAEVVRGITELEASRMSDRVRRAAAQAGRSRGPEGPRERIARRLRGDLDTIVARALKKNASERYPTVDALAEDVVRALENRPVSARPDGLGYRIRKLLARRRLESAAVALAALALAGSTLIALRQARRSTAERDRALEALRRAEITNDFSTFLLSEATPAGGRPLSKADLLARGEQVIGRRFAGDPELETHMLLILAERYFENYQYAEWVRTVERAFERSRGIADRSLRSAATCAMARATVESDATRSRRMLAEATATLVALPGSEAELARCRLAEAGVALVTNDFETAIRAAGEALALERRRGGPPGSELEVLNALALARTGAGRVADAERTFRELLTLFESQGRERTRAAATVRHNLAVALRDSGQVLRAIEESERAAALAVELDPERGAVPASLFVRASALSQAGRHPEAISLVAESLEKARGAGSPNTHFWAAGTAALVHAEAGRIAEAQRLLAEMAEVRARGLSLPEWLTGSRLDRYRAAVALLAGDAATALDAARRAVARIEAADGSWRERIPALVTLVRALNAVEDSGSALELAGHAVALAEAALGDLPASREVGLARLELGVALAGLGKRSDAEGELAAAFAELVRAAGPDSPDARRAEAALAELER